MACGLASLKSPTYIHKHNHSSLWHKHCVNNGCQVCCVRQKMEKNEENGLSNVNQNKEEHSKKIHSDGLKTPWFLFPVPTLYPWHLKMQTLSYYFVADNTHIFIAPSPLAYLPTLKIHYSVAMSSLQIGTGLRD